MPCDLDRPRAVMVRDGGDVLAQNRKLSPHGAPKERLFATISSVDSHTGNPKIEEDPWDARRRASTNR